MPNRETHAASILIPVILLGFAVGFDFIEKHIFYFLAALFGGIAPDLIEPAKHYKHRKFFHSVALLKFVAVVVLPLSGIAGLVVEREFWLISAFCMGYIIHLGLDSLTQMGLPRR